MDRTKKKGFIHYRDSKFYIKHEVKIEKFHAVHQFQTP